MDKKKVYNDELYKCWHPVAYQAEITEKPYGTFLLDEPIVVWRDSQGDVSAMKDVCIHRGTALSLGWVKDDCLVCPYHAWEYDKNGTCVFIPQSPETKIPAKAKTDVYNCKIEFGLVWVKLKTSKIDLPAIPEFNETSWKFVNTGPFDWKCDSSRQVENFTDFGHFPWVHPGLLGDQERPEVPKYSVTKRGMVLHYSVKRPEATNTDDFPIFANDDVAQPERISNYELHLPYTILLRLGWGGKKGMIYFFVSQPISKDKCRGYCIVGRNYNLEDSDKVIQDFEQVIFDQDKRIVESQRPEQVPFDFAEELHLKFDAVAMNYRRAMKSEGFVD